VLVLLVLAILLAPAAANASVDTFTSGADGWATYLTNSTNGSYWSQAPTYSPTGGNPGGYISAGVGSVVNSELYSFQAPSTPFGNLTGQTLTVDLKVSGTVGTVAGAGPAMAQFYIGYDSNDYFISTNGYSISLNNSGGWATYTIPVISANFMAWPGQKGTASFAYVAANPVYVGLVFTSADFSAANDGLNTQGLISANGATISVDNFGTPSPAPLPAAIWLLGSGLVFLLPAIRKRAIRPR
jgi:hypothetical protein